MGWQTPKINWNSDDYFNKDDFNRIKNNLLYIKGFLKKFRGKVTQIQPLNDKNSYTELLHPQDVNCLQANLTRLNEISYNLDIGANTEYYNGSYTPSYEQWNRLETYTLDIKNLIQTDNPGFSRITQKLGNKDSIRGIKI